MSWRRHGVARSESGSMLPMFGALVFIAVLVVALVVDIALLQATYRRAASTADRIAEGAAAMLDVDRLHTDGIVVLDRARATTTAAALAADEGLSGDQVTIEVVDGRICVELRDSYEVVALRAVSDEPVAVRVRSCAAPRVG